LVEALLAIKVNNKVPYKRAFIYTDSGGFKVPLHQYSYIKMLTRKDYITYKGGRYSDRPLKRVILGKITANLGRSNKRRTFN
jgi:hypothetical protein